VALPFPALCAFAYPCPRMIYAFVTTLLFSFSTVLANRSQRAVGTVHANLGRLLIGLFFLGAWTFTLGHYLSGAPLSMFLLSGVVGMGIGDIAFFAALPLLGSRLTIMMMQCLSVPVAIIVERWWLGTQLQPSQLLCSTVILGGIMVALMPTRQDPPKVKVRGLGVIFGALAAIGQGVGAVLSRKGFGLAAASGVPVDGLSAAFPRVVGGLAITLLWYVLHHQIQRWRVVEAPPAPVAPRPSSYLWVLAHGLAGPVLGMGAFQMALAAVPSGIVLPITATTPLMVIPFAYWMEGERPSKRSLVGGVIAVAGAVALTLQ
jgi:drug/metabolite transporter (DMT)-like permease